MNSSVVFPIVLSCVYRSLPFSPPINHRKRSTFRKSASGRRISSSFSSTCICSRSVNCLCCPWLLSVSSSFPSPLDDSCLDSIVSKQVLFFSSLERDSSALQLGRKKKKKKSIIMFTHRFDNALLTSIYLCMVLFALKMTNVIWDIKTADN